MLFPGRAYFSLGRALQVRLLFLFHFFFSPVLRPALPPGQAASMAAAARPHHRQASGRAPRLLKPRASAAGAGRAASPEGGERRPAGARGGQAAGRHPAVPPGAGRGPRRERCGSPQGPARPPVLQRAKNPLCPSRRSLKFTL